MSESGKKKFKGIKVMIGIVVLLISILAGYGIYYIGNIHTDEKSKLVSTSNIEDLNKIAQSNADQSGMENNLEVIDKLEDTVQGVEGEKESAKDLEEEEKELSKDLEEKEQKEWLDLKREKVKGVYVSGPKAGSSKYINELIELVDSTELNAMVIDIKNDSGEITYKMDLPLAKEVGADMNYIQNIESLVQVLKEKDIYLIARIVAFKDPILAQKKPELSIQNPDGSIFRDKAGLAWVNPYNKEVWQYLLDVSKEAAELGFDEIQYDYIRFSTDSRMKNVNFGKAAENKSKMDVITEFTQYAYNTLKPMNVFVSADVYGAIIDSDTDAKIVGQDYKEMAKYLDYICPMVYPSHYAYGSYGIEYPDLEPYQLILKSMEASRKVLDEIPEGEHKAIVRPWLQDFTATWVKHHKKYGGEELKAQMKGVYDSGYEEWILWNGSNNYTKNGLELVK